MKQHTGTFQTKTLKHTLNIYITFMKSLWFCLKGMCVHLKKTKYSYIL
jgi:hypothetical protein